VALAVGKAKGLSEGQVGRENMKPVETVKFRIHLVSDEVPYIDLETSVADFLKSLIGENTAEALDGCVLAIESLTSTKEDRKAVQEGLARKIRKRLEAKGLTEQDVLEDFALLHHPKFQKDLEEALDDVEAGRVVSLEELKKGKEEGG